MFLPAVRSEADPVVYAHIFSVSDCIGFSVSFFVQDEKQLDFGHLPFNYRHLWRSASFHF